MDSQSRVVLLGGTGYVGTAIRSELIRRDVPHHLVSRADCDFFCVESLYEKLYELKPAFLINSAGYTGKPNVDACEQNKRDCLRGNVVLPGVVRECCERLEIPWGHVSSGCIFQGCPNDETGFTEVDVPNFTFLQNNCSFYSGTKALGEELLIDAPDCYIWRLRMPFCNVDSPRNYLSKVMDYERLVNVRNSLSNLDEFATACVDSWEMRIEPGIYHITNSNSVTTAEVVELVKESGLVSREFRFFDSEAEFLTTVDAPRSNCVLDNSKALSAGLKLRDVHETLSDSLRFWNRNWNPSPRRGVNAQGVRCPPEHPIHLQ